ncbi:MAG TPA: IS701 family transposase [Gaiellaceae bacterium]|nr:IS701 family transposase [Gaiellaceae bacterium]
MTAISDRDLSLEVDPRTLKKLDAELTEFVDELFSGLGRKERVENLGHYVTGLLLDGERKSIEPIAGRLVDRPEEIEGMRQRLQQAVTVATWSERELFRRLARKVDGELPGIEAFVLDDTGFPKKGSHSVGVQRQYSGTLGRVDNCQVAVSLHLAGEAGSACIAMDLFLPEPWANDRRRREKAGVPDDIEFKTKLEIALRQLDAAIHLGIRRHVVLGDAAYGDSIEFRDELEARGLQYVLAVKGESVVWPPGSNPRVPRKTTHLGRPRSRYYDKRHPPIAIGDLAPKLTFRSFTWREGSRGAQSARFAVARIKTAHHHCKGAAPGNEQWLIAQWFEGEPTPTKFWLSNLPSTMSARGLIRLAKLRWRVERDYQEMKGELGLDHFEGRTWRGFHHHAALCAAAHTFLALRRALFPPKEESLDAPNGAALPSGRARTPNWRLPAVPKADRTARPADGTVTNVIESY